MEWADPAVMADSEIEAELGDLVAKLSEAQASGSKTGELEARQWRLRAEQSFRQRRRGESWKS